MRILVAGLIAVGLLLSAPASAAPAVPPTTTEPPDQAGDAEALEQRLLARIDTLAKAGAKGCAAARPDLVIFAHNRLFPQVSEATRRRALLIIIGCTAGEDGEGLAAARHLEPIAATAVERGAANYQLMLDEQIRAPLSAARRLKVVLDDFPVALSDWEASWFASMLRAAPEDPALELALLSRLVAMDWTHPSAQAASKSWWRMDLARRQTGLNNLIALRDTLRPVNGSSDLVSVAQDRRFSPLWDEMQAAGRFDWLAVGEAELALKRKAAVDAPRSLAAVRQLMQSLRMLGRFDEAAAVGQAARDRLAEPKAFDDQDRASHWTLNDLAYAYSEAGKSAQADAVFREALSAGAKYGDRVSQPVNYSEELVRMGRGGEALTLLQAVADKDGSPIGVTWRDASIVCAQVDLDRAKANALADDLVRRWEINPAATSHALLCLDRVADAANLMVKRLASDQHRADALTAAVIGRRPPGLNSAWDQRMEANRRALWARPEVVAALEAVGRRLDLPYYGIYWGAE